MTGGMQGDLQARFLAGETIDPRAYAAEHGNPVTSVMASVALLRKAGVGIETLPSDGPRIKGVPPRKVYRGTGTLDPAPRPPSGPPGGRGKAVRAALLQGEELTYDEAKIRFGFSTRGVFINAVKDVRSAGHVIDKRFHDGAWYFKVRPTVPDTPRPDTLEVVEPPPPKRRRATDHPAPVPHLGTALTVVGLFLDDDGVRVALRNGEASYLCTIQGRSASPS